MESELVHIPDKAAAAEPGTLPKHYGKRNNLAENDEITAKFWKLAESNYTHFKDQKQRDAWCKTSGKLDIADRMERCARRQDDSDEQHQRTKSKITSTIYYRNARIITASLNKYFGLIDTYDLPAEYEPEQDMGDYGPMEGAEVAKQHDALETHTFDKDQRRSKLKDINWQLVKYGNCLVGNEWERRVRMRPVKHVSQISDDPDKMPVKFTWKDEEVTEKDCPSISITDLKDAYFDSQLESDDWLWLILHRQRAWSWLNDQQAQGEMMNVGKLEKAHLYTGEDGRSDVMHNRSVSSDENASTETTGNWETWEVYGVVPIKEEGDKATWDDKNPPTLYWGTYAGKMGDTKAICLRLIKLPHKHGKIPHKLIHLLRDDKGAWHDGFAFRGESLYWQIVKNWNQANDNIDLRCLVPWASDGPVRSRDLTFRVNKLIRLGRGTKLQQLKVDDTTAYAIPNAVRIEEAFQKLMGADKPVHGESAFARTAATQAQLNYDQALLPIDDMASYVADQLFPWLLLLDAEYWRQYGDPKRILSITHKSLHERINPANLSGPLKVKVVAVTRFRNTRQHRQEINNLLNNIILPARQEIGREGVLAAIRWALRENHAEKINEIIPLPGDYDAEDRAVNEVQQIMRGEWIAPEARQNQEIHLRVEEPHLRSWQRLPDTDNDFYAARGYDIPRAIQMLERHIEMEKEFLEQKNLGTTGQTGPGQQPAEGGPGLPGEQAGDVIAAQEGAAVNA